MSKDETFKLVTFNSKTRSVTILSILGLVLVVITRFGEQLPKLQLKFFHRNLTGFQLQ